MSDLSMNAKIHNARLEADLDLSDLPGGETGDEPNTLVSCDDCHEEFDRTETGVVRCSDCHETATSGLIDLDDCTCDECCPSQLTDLKERVHEATVERAVDNAAVAMRFMRESWNMDCYEDSCDSIREAIEMCMADVRSHLDDVLNAIEGTTRNTDI